MGNTWYSTWITLMSLNLMVFCISKLFDPAELIVWISRSRDINGFKVIYMIKLIAHVSIFMSVIAGQMAGPNWLNFL